LSNWGLFKAYLSMFFGAFTGRVKYFWVVVDDNGRRVACYKNVDGDFVSVSNGVVVMTRDGLVVI